MGSILKKSLSRKLKRVQSMQGYRRSLPDISFHLRPFWLQSWMHMISIIGVETSKIYVFCV